jgi:hypothetical protein
MRKHLQIFTIFATIVVLMASLVIILYANNRVPFEGEQSSPNYLTYQGNSTKIFLIATNTSFSSVNESYSLPDGRLVHKGSLLFTISLTLRNDYTSEDPPPPTKNFPIAPADGTAYLYLTAKLSDTNGIINSSDVTVPDFSLPSTPGASIVLASGQTSSINIDLLVDQKNIINYSPKVIFIGDSIPI